MTVGRLLAAAISATFLLALVGVEAIILRSAQGHLQRQLESLSQDAATSLGLSLGVPIARLRLTYVKSLKLNQPHMVLAYYATPTAEPLVLDNLEDSVRPASQRRDLVPVYSFNDEEVWVEMRGRVGSPQQLRNWRALMERLDWERRT